MEEKTLDNLLKENNVQKIENFEDFQKYFDLTNLDGDGSPKLLTDKQVLFIFDNKDFNETYLIDLINEYLKEENSTKFDEIFYCDSTDMRLKLFHKDFEKTIETEKELERNILKPGFLFTYKKENSIHYVQEGFIPFNSESVSKILNSFN